MRVVGPDGLALALAERGAGPPLLLVHGFGGSAGAWGEAPLAGLARQHRVLAVDLLGHGGSDAPGSPARVELTAVLDDLERMLDAARVESCAWIGYSMGGRIALAAALLRADRVSRVVLESASPGLERGEERHERRRRDEELARRIESGGVAAWVEAWEADPLFAGRAALPAEVKEPFLALRRANRPAALSAWLRGLGAGSQPSFWDRLGEVSAPVLFVTGSEDDRYTEIAERMGESLRSARHAVIAGAGHTVHLEAPAAWLKAVLPFLAEDDIPSGGARS